MVPPMRKLIAIALLTLTAPASAQIFPGRGVVGTNLTINTLTTGTVLEATAAVSADGRYVTMNVHPQQSSLEGFDLFQIPNTSNGNALPQAMGIRRIPFRQAQIGKVTFVEKHKKLLALPVAPMQLENTSLKSAAKKLAEST